MLEKQGSFRAIKMLLKKFGPLSLIINTSHSKIWAWLWHLWLHRWLIIESVKCFANQKGTLRHIKELFIREQNLSKHLSFSWNISRCFSYSQLFFRSIYFFNTLFDFTNFVSHLINLKFWLFLKYFMVVFVHFKPFLDGLSILT